MIKNDSAIDGAKTAPWWIAVIMFIIGTFLPLIPIMVNNSKTYGAQYISSTVYGYEQGLATGAKTLKEAGYEFVEADIKYIPSMEATPKTDGGDVVLSVPALSAGVLTITTIRTK